MSARTTFAVWFSVVLITCSSTIAAPNGTIFLIGGAEWDNNTDIYGGMVNIAGGSNASIGIVTAASDDPENFGPDGSYFLFHEIFSGYSPKTIQWVPIDTIHPENNANATVVENLKQLSLIFFSGGDQSFIYNSFFNRGHAASPALAALRDKYNSTRGFVIAGTSAGTACQSRAVMVLDGVSYSALVNGSFAYNSTGDDNLLYQPEGGLGFFPRLIDTRFSVRGRQGRLIRLLSDTASSVHGSTIGVGVDQDTALVSHTTSPDTYSIVGHEGVWWFDVSNSSVGLLDGQWHVAGVHASYATRGDNISLQTGQITPAAWKLPLRGRETLGAPMASQDVFNSPYTPDADTPAACQFTLMASSLFDSPHARTVEGRTFETGPQFCVYLTRGATNDSIAWDGQSFNRRYISFQGLQIDIRVCPTASNTPGSTAVSAAILFLVVIGSLVVLVLLVVAIRASKDRVCCQFPNDLRSSSAAFSNPMFSTDSLESDDWAEDDDATFWLAKSSEAWAGQAPGPEEGAVYGVTGALPRPRATGSGYFQLPSQRGGSR